MTSKLRKGRRFAGWLAITTLVFGCCGIAYGQDEGPDPVFLRAGQPAPFDGDLVAPAQMAGFLVRIDHLQAVHQVEVAGLKAQLSLVQTNRRDEVQLLQDRLDTADKALAEVRDPPFYDASWFRFTAGFVSGAAAVWAVLKL